MSRVLCYSREENMQGLVPTAMNKNDTTKDKREPANTTHHKTFSLIHRHKHTQHIYITLQQTTRVSMHYVDKMHALTGIQLWYTFSLTHNKLIAHTYFFTHTRPLFSLRLCNKYTQDSNPKHSFWYSACLTVGIFFLNSRWP